ncbi:MAG TPA: alkaline phosphatase family protein [Acidimicrobiales bacterium]|nr:alkaline phosphatase family protein [Acidimicrobiales bacterium]
MDHMARGSVVAQETPDMDGGDAALVLPDYGGACIASVVPALLRRDELAAAGTAPAWLPEVALGARQVVLLVLDGLGYEQLVANTSHAPTLRAMSGGPITSVAPTTTAAALTSISTGRAPAAHGVLGYRLCARGSVLNVLRWTVDGKDARASFPPASLQPLEPFLGRRPPVVSKAEFAGTGFTDAHLPGARLIGWRMPSAICVEVAGLLRAGEPFVYAYYDGIDKIAHDRGLGEHFAAELRATDRLVLDLLDALPPGAALVVTADHGQVEVGSDPIVLAGEVTEDVVLLSGEGRFRWLHAAPGATKRVAERCREHYSDVAWVRTREEIVADGWFGGPLRPELEERLGDVALVARERVAFFDPSDTGELRLVARHGSLTSAEMLVPLLAAAP